VQPEPAQPVVPPVQPEPASPDDGVVVRPSATEPVAGPLVQPVEPVVTPPPRREPVVPPAEPVTPPAEPVKPVTPPVEPVKPDEPVQPAPPVVAGPRPDAPGGAAEPGTMRLPEDLRPMLPVAFFFTDAAAGESSWPASSLEATWSTNQGERGLDEVELKDHFELAAGRRLPVVAVTDPGRESTVIELRVKQPGFAWWVARIGQLDWEPSDLNSYLRNGRIELAVRGAAGEEAIRIGVFDRQEPPQVALVPLALAGAITTDWQILRVRSGRSKQPIPASTGAASAASSWPAPTAGR